MGRESGRERGREGETETETEGLEREQRKTSTNSCTKDKENKLHQHH